jgi:hypothetical protein
MNYDICKYMQLLFFFFMLTDKLCYEEMSYHYLSLPLDSIISLVKCNNFVVINFKVKNTFQSIFVETLNLLISRKCYRTKKYCILPLNIEDISVRLIDASQIKYRRLNESN